MKRIGTRILLATSLMLASCTTPVRQPKKEGAVPSRGPEIEQYQPECSRPSGLIFEGTRVETIGKMPWGQTITYEQDPTTSWVLQLRGYYTVKGTGINGVQYYCGQDGKFEETHVNGSGNATVIVSEPSGDRSFTAVFTEHSQ